MATLARISEDSDGCRGDADADARDDEPAEELDAPARGVMAVFQPSEASNRHGLETIAQLGCRHGRRRCASLVAIGRVFMASRVEMPGGMRDVVYQGRGCGSRRHGQRPVRLWCGLDG
jgi:hypothetical protein